MHLAWPSPSIPKLLDGTHTVKITSNEASWLAVMSLIGSVFGGVIAGPILNRFGRLKPIIDSSIPYAGAWLAIAFAPHVAILFASRFIVGITDTFAYSSVFMYVGEIADPRIRGLLGTYCANSVIIGMLVVNAMGLYISIYATALISISVPVLLFLTSVGLPESPYFYITKGRDEDAIRSLKRFKHPELVQDEFDRLKKSLEEDMKKQGKFLDLFRISYYLKALIILTILRSTKSLVGLSAVTFYTETIFSDVEGGISAETWVILFYVVKLLTTIFISVIIDKIGRKPLLLISTIGITLSLLCVAIYSFLEDAGDVDVSKYDFIPIVALFSYIIAYSIGLGPVAVLMLGELMPNNVKSYALCIVNTVYCLTGTLSSLFFQNTNDSFVLGVPFISFAFCSVLSVGFVVIFVPETKGKTLEEIQETFQGKSIKIKSYKITEIL